ncbi:MAG: hypothetical protein Tsb0013_18560 [Phycisphaerales bacterium]
MSVTAAQRLPWHDKYNQPTIEDLRGHYTNPQALALLDQARERLQQFEGIEEHLTWQGMPWRWCLAYTKEGDPTAALAFLVPDPERASIACPLIPDMLRSMPAHRFKKHLKEVLLLANLVDGVYWPTFELTSKAQTEDVLDLVRRKFDFVIGKAKPRDGV